MPHTQDNLPLDAPPRKRASDYTTASAPWMDFAEISQAYDTLEPVAAVCERSGLSKSRVYEKVKAGTFPAPASVGGRSLWSTREVGAWVQWQLSRRGAA